MSNTNDDSRQSPRASERVDTLAPEPVRLPEPEPLVAAEPPPHAPIGLSPVEPGIEPPAPGRSHEGPAAVEPVETSWRYIVGAAREQDRHAVATPIEARELTIPPGSGNSGEVPTSGGSPEGPLPAEDTTIGTLGDEPMGGVPREEPALPPGVAPLVPGDINQQTQLRQTPAPTITLARVGEELFAWLKTLASAAVYATLIVTFGFQVARVEGQSMAPTLENQDRLIVNKLAYRIGEPQVGDIVMLYYPLNPDKSFVKRVIAEEGDQIRIVEGRVYRNDVPVNDDYVPPDYRSHDDYGPEVVPQGYYFVMGDHRNNSSDSRHWKFVPKKYIIGKVQLRWWPLPQARIF